MTVSLKKWRKNTWPSEKKYLRKLPFVAKKPIAKNFDDNGILLTSIMIDFRVNLPMKGPVCDVREIETVLICLSNDFPNNCPDVLVRPDFPSVPHLSSIKQKHRLICLTRDDTNDWWCGKTLIELVKDIYDWLCDAAAGMLVKENDPFEPLIVSGTTPVELCVKTVLEKCSKHNGAWKTTSKYMCVGDGNNARFIVGSGDVDTQIFYQGQEQSELWIDPPSNIEELIIKMGKLGFDKEQVRYWIEKKKHLLLVVGVKRPRTVLGRMEANEWVAFELKRDKAKERSPWDIQPHIVLESFSPSIAAVTSGFQPQCAKVVIIGAGALGSEICESLGRSGIAHITLIDNDRLRPHNLARHTLSNKDIGENKAYALATKLNLLFGHDICVPIQRNLLEIPREELLKIIEKTDCVIDCSASRAVQYRLSDMLPEGKPLISGFQIDAGNGTVFLYSPDIKTVTHDMLESILVSRLIHIPVVSNWLEDTGDTIVIGGGCRAITSKIPGSIVKFGAGWLADKILNILNSKVWPSKPVVELLQYQNEDTTTIHLHQVGVEDVIMTKSEEWLIMCPRYVFSKINDFAEKAVPYETGGVLIGRIDRQRKIMYTTEAWKAPDDSQASQTGFSRGLAGLKNQIAMLEKDTNEFLSYIGEWHSHPPLNRPDFSSVDTATSNRMAEELAKDRIPAVCLITNSKDCRTHVVEQKK